MNLKYFKGSWPKPRTVYQYNHLIKCIRSGFEVNQNLFALVKNRRLKDRLHNA